MRTPKDRRNTNNRNPFPLEDNNHVIVTANRRKTADRRLGNLNTEQRQLQLSEIPWTTFYRRFRKE